MFAFAIGGGGGDKRCQLGPGALVLIGLKWLRHEIAGGSRRGRGRDAILALPADGQALECRQGHGAAIKGLYSSQHTPKNPEAVAQCPCRS
jgi:hypothetical protein